MNPNNNNTNIYQTLHITVITELLWIFLLIKSKKKKKKDKTQQFYKLTEIFEGFLYLFSSQVKGSVRVHQWSVQPIILVVAEDGVSP